CYLSTQILPNQREPVPRVQGALQGVGNIQHGIVHQHFDVLSQIPRLRVPERLVQLRKAPTQTAQDLADRIAVSDALGLYFAGTAIAADKFGDPGHDLNLHLASGSGVRHLRYGHRWPPQPPTGRESATPGPAPAASPAGACQSYGRSPRFRTRRPACAPSEA